MQEQINYNTIAQPQATSAFEPISQAQPQTNFGSTQNYSTQPQTQPQSGFTASITTQAPAALDTNITNFAHTQAQRAFYPQHENLNQINTQYGNTPKNQYASSFSACASLSASQNQNLANILNLAKMIADAQRETHVNAGYNSFSGTQNHAETYKYASNNTTAKAQPAAAFTPYAQQNPAYGKVNEPINELKSATDADTNSTLPENPASDKVISDSETYWNNISDAQSQYLQSTPARQTLKTYLQAHCAHLNSDELNQILTMAKELENQAVAVFKAKGTHKTKLQEQNRTAISKLHTDSASFNGTNPQHARVFTRSEIGKMSIKEFLANQREILAQHAKGAIL